MNKLVKKAAGKVGSVVGYAALYVLYKRSVDLLLKATDKKK